MDLQGHPHPGKVRQGVDGLARLHVGPLGGFTGDDHAVRRSREGQGLLHPSRSLDLLDLLRAEPQEAQLISGCLQPGGGAGFQAGRGIGRELALSRQRLKELLLGRNEGGTVDHNHGVPGPDLLAREVHVQPLQAAGDPGGDAPQARLVVVDPSVEAERTLHFSALHRVGFHLHEGRRARAHRKDGEGGVAFVLQVGCDGNELHPTDGTPFVGVGGAYLRVHGAGEPLLRIGRSSLPGVVMVMVVGVVVVMGQRVSRHGAPARQERRHHQDHHESAHQETHPPAVHAPKDPSRSVASVTIVHQGTPSLRCASSLLVRILDGTPGVLRPASPSPRDTGVCGPASERCRSAHLRAAASGPHRARARPGA